MPTLGWFRGLYGIHGASGYSTLEHLEGLIIEVHDDVPSHPLDLLADPTHSYTPQSLRFAAEGRTISSHTLGGTPGSSTTRPDPWKGRRNGIATTCASRPSRRHHSGRVPDSCHRSSLLGGLRVAPCAPYTGLTDEGCRCLRRKRWNYHGQEVLGEGSRRWRV